MTIQAITAQILALTAEDSVLLWLLKMTLLLSLAWVLHFALNRANPRWRVFLWRATCVGLMLLTVADAWRSYASVKFETATMSVSRSLDAPPGLNESNETAPASANDFSAGLGVADTEISEVNLHGSMTKSGDLPTALPQKKDNDSNWSLKKHVREISVWIWLIGVALLLTRLMVGSLLIRRVIKRSRTVPHWVLEPANQLANRMRLSPVEIVSSDHISSPIVVGGFRKTILLPSSLCREDYRREMRSILSHELAHVRRHDLAWNWLLHLIATFLWPHPAIWRIRSAHVAACELVADIESAQTIGDTNAYRRTLAMVALQANGSPVSGLAMARSSCVRRRIQLLPDTIQFQNLKRPLLFVAILMTVTIAIGIGGMRVVLANPPEQEKDGSTETEATPEAGDAKQPDEKKMSIAVVDADGKPVPDVELTAALGGGGFGKIDHENGQAIIDINRFDADYFAVRAKAPGFVPLKATWRQVNQTRPIPPEFTFKMEAGTTIGCTINNEEGQPIKGVIVRVLVPGNENDMPRVDIWDHKEVTDEHGRWQCNIVPKKLNDVWLRLEHPDYISDNHYGATIKPSIDQLRDLSGDMVMKKGITLTGRVVGDDGSPLAGVSVFQGEDRFGSNFPSTTTDLDGNFRFSNCQPGPMVLTISQAGFAPELRKLDISTTIKPLNIQLKKGQLLTVKVVDGDGNPISGVWLAADTWQGCRSLCDAGIPRETDINGLWSWAWAPMDAVEFDILKRGYMVIRNQELTAREKPYEIVLKKPLRLSGKVIDKETRKPVEDFSIVSGTKYNRSQVSWNNRSKKDFHGGSFEFTFGEPRQFLMRITAPGYLPATSRLFDTTDDDHGDVSYDFELSKGQDVAGSVVMPDGSPAAKAQVALAINENGASRFRIQDGRFQRGATVVETDLRGQFSFPPVENDYVVIVHHEAGFAEVSRKQLEAKTQIKLAQWSAIEGVAKTGRDVDPDVRMNVGCIQDVPVYSMNFTVRTDQNGRFRLTRVPPNMTFQISKPVRIGNSSMYSHGIWLQTESGKTHHVQVGGTGRPLIGKVVVPGTDSNKLTSTNVSALTGAPALPADYDQMTDEEHRDWHRTWVASTSLRDRRLMSSLRFPIRLNQDGTFRIDDVPAGHYNLNIDLRLEIEPGKQFAGKFLGNIRKRIEVKPMKKGRSDKAQLLGILKPDESE